MKIKHASLEEATEKVAKFQQDLDVVYKAMFENYELHEKKLANLPQVARDRFIQSGSMRSMAQIVLTNLTYRVMYLSLPKSSRDDNDEQQSTRSMNKEWQAKKGLTTPQFVKYSRYKIDMLIPLVEDLVKETMDRWNEYEKLSTERVLTPQEILQEFKNLYLNSTTSIVHAGLTQDNWWNTLIKVTYTNKGDFAEGGPLRKFYGACEFKGLQVMFDFREPGAQIVLLDDFVQSPSYSNWRVLTKDDFLSAPDRTIEVTLNSQWQPDNCVVIIQDADDSDVISCEEPSSSPPGILDVDKTLTILGKKVIQTYRPAIIDSNVGRSEINLCLGGNSLVQAKLIVNTTAQPSE